MSLEFLRVISSPKTLAKCLQPRPDGMIESFNRTPKKPDERQADWNQRIPLVLMAFRPQDNPQDQYS